MARNIIVNGKKEKVDSDICRWLDSLASPNLWCSSICYIESSDDGYICTRKPGHTGHHVAHDFRDGKGKAIAMWSQKGEDDVSITIRMNGENIEISDNHYNALADLFHGSNELGCGSGEPGRRFMCTCKKGHEGMHVAHYADKRVISAWDEEYKYGDADNQVKETNMGKKVRVNGEMRVLDDEQYQYYASKSGKQGEPLCRDAEPREYGNDGWHCTCKKDHSGSCVAHEGLGGKVLSV